MTRSNYVFCPRETSPTTEPFKASDLLVIRPKHNSPGKRDVSGAFAPEAKKFMQLHGGWREEILDNKLRKFEIATQLNGLLDAYRPRVLAFFCHGYTLGTQLTVYAPTHRKAQRNKRWVAVWEEMIRLLSSHVNPIVVLYACSTGNDPDDNPDTAPGSGDGSFADQLRDALCQNGARFCRVVAHTTAGHATRNPFVKFFDGRGSPIGGTGAPLLVPPSTREFRKLRCLLKTDWRFQFPFMTVGQIHEELTR